MTPGHTEGSRSSTRRLLYRWVDAGAAQAYIADNRIDARSRHYLPPQVSGLRTRGFHPGVSCSEDRHRWSMDYAICFVLDAARLRNRIVNLAGQEIYTLSQHIEYMQAMRAHGHKTSIGDQQALATYWANALSESRAAPDEAYVLGNIEDLNTVLEDIVVHRDVPAPVLADLRHYADRHGVRLTDERTDGS